LTQEQIKPTPFPVVVPLPVIDPTKKPVITYIPPVIPKPTEIADPDLQKLKDLSEQNKTLIEQLPFLIPILLAADTAFNAKQKLNVKEGVCEESAPNGCINNAVKQNTDDIGAKVDAGNAIRDANDAAQTGLLAQLLANLASFREWVEAAFNNTVVDKVVNLLTLITALHNAAMLSTSIKDTLVEAISNGLATIGIKIKSPDGSPLDLNTALNSSIENLLKGILGADNYASLKLTWAKGNRIIQSGAAVINTARSLYDSARSLNELTGDNVGRIGNALRKDGAVSENAYRAMSENNTQVNVRMQQLENLEESVSTLSSITSETYSITEQVGELTKQKDDFNKNIAELAPKTQIENIPLKTIETSQKAVSVSPPIPLIELYKPEI
jgi:hypothetical protein